MARLDEVLAGDATWGRWALDQAGHAGLGAAYALAASSAVFFLTHYRFPVALGVSALVAILGGVVREVVGYSTSGKLHLLDRAIDAAFHLVGVPVGVALACLLRSSFL